MDEMYGQFDRLGCYYVWKKENGSFESPFEQNETKENIIKMYTYLEKSEFPPINYFVQFSEFVHISLALHLLR